MSLWGKRTTSSNHRAPEGQGVSPSEEPVSKHKKVIKAKIALGKKRSQMCLHEKVPHHIFNNCNPNLSHINNNINRHENILLAIIMSKEASLKPNEINEAVTSSNMVLVLIISGATHAMKKTNELISENLTIKATSGMALTRVYMKTEVSISVGFKCSNALLAMIRSIASWHFG